MPGARRILVVDDLADQRRMYGAYLEHEGYEVRTAANGTEAIALAVEFRPDLIVMDLSMPGLDGFEATRVLKQMERTRDIPVLALTAYGEHLPEEWAREVGCAAYLRKPLLPGELAEHCARWLPLP
ncbi:MAG TPA: response regulator [Vicinamibacteria bacterium]